MNSRDAMEYDDVKDYLLIELRYCTSIQFELVEDRMCAWAGKATHADEQQE